MLLVSRGRWLLRRRRWDCAWCKGLAICPKQLSARRNTSGNSRDRDKCRRARGRDRLKDAFLVHSGTVLAFATRSTLIAAASDLETVSHTRHSSKHFQH